MKKKLSRKAFFCQDFRGLFQAPGYFDRPGAFDAIRKGREVLKELAPLEKQTRELRAKLRRLHLQALEALENADPRKSP